MEQREWTTSGKRERKQASSQDTSIPRAPLSRTSMGAKVHAYLRYLTASVSHSVNQSAIRVYLTIPDYPFVPACLPACLPVCLRACLSACSLAFSRYISLHDKYYLPSPLLNSTYPSESSAHMPPSLFFPSLTLLYLKPDASKWKEAVVVTVLVYKMTILPSIHSTPGRFHILRLL